LTPAPVCAARLAASIRFSLGKCRTIAASTGSTLTPGTLTNICSVAATGVPARWDSRQSTSPKVIDVATAPRSRATKRTALA
jgi:hypothetical protein